MVTTTRPYATTNARLAEALEIINELIDWADADVEHSTESEAKDQAREDFRRATALRQAKEILQNCER